MGAQQTLPILLSSRKPKGGFVIAAFVGRPCFAPELPFAQGHVLETSMCPHGNYVAPRPQTKPKPAASEAKQCATWGLVVVLWLLALLPLWGNDEFPFAKDSVLICMVS